MQIAAIPFKNDWNRFQQKIARNMSSLLLHGYWLNQKLIGRYAKTRRKYPESTRMKPLFHHRHGTRSSIAFTLPGRLLPSWIPSLVLLVLRRLFPPEIP